MSANSIMASITLPAPISVVPMSRYPRITARHGVTVNSTRVLDSGDYTVEETRSKRRDIVFTAAVAAACSVAKIALAEEEPKRGTEEAKKKYAPICVTMPTARICHK
ncbi:hypothetical protein RND81_09G257600 [Saponaria officinalis]|uniref:Photosystem II 5 kDa protein, chloroplastic n=1 Tax=Saponaria officinalis TaxID=3572 RepID=A0AAW1IQL7_SAPOF